MRTTHNEPATRPRLLAWSLFHDVGGSGLNADLATTGLRISNGKPKARASSAFRDLRNRQAVSGSTTPAHRPRCGFGLG